MPKNRHLSFGDMQAQKAREKKLAQLSPVVAKPVEPTAVQPSPVAAPAAPAAKPSAAPAKKKSAAKKAAPKAAKKSAGKA